MAHPDVLYPQPCPFCAIAQVYPPPRPPPALWHDEHDPALLSTYVPSLAALPSASTSDDAGADAQLGKRQVEAQKLTPPAYVLLSAPGVLAFLDIMPLSYGHVLVATREHRRTLAEVRSNTEGREIGFWLPVVARAVAKASGTEDANIVQNNGVRAAQVVPHVHFHVIPRHPTETTNLSRSWTVFGRGQRADLDEEEADILVQNLRDAMRDEIERLGIEGGPKEKL